MPEDDIEPLALPPERPELIFFAEAGGDELLRLLQAPGALDTLASGGFGIAVALTRLDDALARAVRLLNRRGVPAVAWLALPPEDGQTLNLQNYPRAAAAYRAFRHWATSAGLRFDAVGLDIEPPLGELGRGGWRALRAVADRLWLARDNALYPSARAAYVELVAAIQRDGYEVHTYQLPLIADDRRAGTTIVQRALDIVDPPADLDVLVCSSGVPVAWLAFDLGGALISSYGPAADALAVGAGPSEEDGADARAWPALRRDLLLAARHAEVIYIATLEACVRGGLLARIAELDWSAPAAASIGRRLLVEGVRALLLVALIAGRFGRTALAWSGWLLALVLWLRRPRR
jgi:hypothetical protein